jgi:hypothetical protein
MNDSEVKEGMAIVMSKRELAAMFAMVGFCSNPECATMAMSRLAESSRVMADALLAALKEEPK